MLHSCPTKRKKDTLQIESSGNYKKESLGQESK